MARRNLQSSRIFVYSRDRNPLALPVYHERYTYRSDALVGITIPEPVSIIVDQGDVDTGY